ncbi:DUF2970 domain-containing protein [Parachitinimonas caeni]|uniref:DUF2970 domain-containing protein n=1 Tax=Parachitinimonas caeni TaxID=3031301 RepID=UPI0027E54730|nr:DUF2970 domain-containing protein [Parachitinimonas caeni]
MGNPINPFRAILAVLSAFFGVRRGKDSKNDVSKLTIWQIIFAAIFCAAVFIFLLITLVRSVTH